jgi:hypothetical protein
MEFLSLTSRTKHDQILNGNNQILLKILIKLNENVLEDKLYYIRIAEPMHLKPIYKNSFIINYDVVGFVLV